MAAEHTVHAFLPDDGSKDIGGIGAKLHPGRMLVCTPVALLRR